MKKTPLILSIIIALVLIGGVLIYTKNPSSTNKTFSTEIKNLTEAKQNSIVELKNGDTYNLTADIVKKEIDGQEVKMLGYNGSIPGPTIKVPQGSEITVNFTNNTDVETTIHPHGVRLDSVFDGVVGPDQVAIKPGQSFSYKLKFPDAGVFWYHPHVREDYAQELGMYGNFIVTPTDAEYYSPVNQEIPLFVDDILMQGGKIASFNTQTTDHTLMGRFGNVMLVNGETHYNLNAKQGEVIRFYITNSANTRPFNLTIPGAKIKLVGADNGKYEKETYVDSFVLAPSERAIVDVLFNKSGTYKLENKTPNQTYSLATITVSNDKIATSYQKEFNTLRTNADVIKDIDAFRPYFNKPADKKITLTVDMGNMNMGGMHMNNMQGMHMMPDGTMMRNDGSMVTSEPIEWEDNMQAMNAQSTDQTMKWNIVDTQTGKKGMDIDWTFKKGDKVKVEIYNDPNTMHPMQHPIHFHGQRFLVLSTNGVKNDNLVWKDTTLVKTGDRVEILVDMSNPGNWMAHCHISEHLVAGMMLNFKVK